MHEGATVRHEGSSDPVPATGRQSRRLNPPVTPQGTDRPSRSDTDRSGGDAAWRSAVRQALGSLSALLPVGIVATDPEGRCWYHNQRWEDFSGITGQSFRDRLWFEALYPDDIEEVSERWGRVLAGRGRLGSFRVLSATGTVRSCWGESVAMVDHEGAIEGHLIVITDAVQAQTPVAPRSPSPPASAATGGTPGTLSSIQPLDVVLERSREIVVILNADGSWRWSNGGTVRLLGHQANFDAAEGVARFIHPDDVPVVADLLARAVGGRLAPEEIFEVRVRAADGSWHQLEGVIDVLLDDPAVQGLVVHATDVTDRRRVASELEASNRRLAELFSTVRTALLLQDEGERVILANQAFVDLFHLPNSPKSIEGRTLSSMGLAFRDLVFDPPDAAVQAERMLAERRRVLGLRMTLLDGRTLEHDYVPMFVNGVFRGHLSAYVDCTDRVRAEEERERLLASEREENRRLAEMDAYRSEFLAAVSHELRTPLTSIVGYADLLRSSLDSRSDASAEERGYVDAIVRSVERLLRLAGDLVALDSMEAGTSSFTPGEVDVEEVLRFALSTVQPAAASASVEVDISCGRGPTVRGDPHRVEQLFENLLTNAVKFTPAGGRVSVRAVSRYDDWKVEITDTGIGIPRDEQKMLFSRFFRGSNVRRVGIGGNGLGLSIAHAIAEMHGGRISIRSKVGVGTTATVYLPTNPG